MDKKPDSLDLQLTSAEEATYFQWVRTLSARYAEEDEILEEVTVSFTFTPMGTHVVAHTGPAVSSGHFIILREF